MQPSRAEKPHRETGSGFSVSFVQFVYFREDPRAGSRPAQLQNCIIFCAICKRRPPGHHTRTACTNHKSAQRATMSAFRRIISDGSKIHKAIDSHTFNDLLLSEKLKKFIFYSFRLNY